MVVCFINGKRYIGKTNDIKTRFARHKRDARNGREDLPKLYNAIRKYGENNFCIGILESFKNDEDAYDAEYNYIKTHDTQTSGYNCSAGGWGTGSGPDCYWYGKHHSDETKKKISETLKANGYQKGRKRPQHVREAVSKAMTGSKNHRSKLTESDVQEILSAWFALPEDKRIGYGTKPNFWRAFVSENYNISCKGLSDILRGDRWHHIWQQFCL